MNQSQPQLFNSCFFLCLLLLICLFVFAGLFFSSVCCCCFGCCYCCCYFCFGIWDHLNVFDGRRDQESRSVAWTRRTRQEVDTLTIDTTASPHTKGLKFEENHACCGLKYQRKQDALHSLKLHRLTQSITSTSKKRIFFLHTEQFWGPFSLKLKALS